MQVCGQKSIFAALLPTEVTKKSGIYVLTQENFDAFLLDNEYVLVDFYPKPVPGLKPLFEEFAKAAQILANKGSPIKLAKVDCNIEDVGWLEKFEIEWNKYSTVKIFKRDPETSHTYVRMFPYNGFFIAEDIVSWVERFIRGELEEYNNKGIKKITHDLSFYLGVTKYLYFMFL